RRQPALDEPLVQPRVDAVAENRGEHLEGEEVRMRRARPQVRQRDEAGVALSLDDDAALAFLRRLGRDDLRNRPGGLREGAELAVEESERGVDVEVAGEDRLAVVGMEERA